jgi:hypothetical protein
MCFWGSKWCFLVPKMAIKAIVVNPIDLVVSFQWPCSTPQSEFPIKSYDRLKLRWSDFDFYFFYLISSFFLCLSSLFLYMKIDEKWLVIREISVLNFNFWIVGLGWTNSEIDNLWEQMLLVRWDILDIFLHMNIC